MPHFPEREFWGLLVWTSESWYSVQGPLTREQVQEVERKQGR